MKKLCLFSLSLLCIFSAKAQESIGLFQDNYLPANGMLRNPAAPVFSTYPWQVNVISAGAFGENNLVYAPGYTTLRLLSGLNNQAQATINFANVNDAHAHFYSFIQGPSAFVQLKNGITIGLITDEKYAGSLVSIAAPQSLAVFQHVALGSDYMVPQFKAGYLHWDEIGINLGTKLYETNDASLAVGVNLKYLGSTDGFYLNNNKSFSTSRDSVLSTQNYINTSFGYTSTAGDNRPGSPFDFAFNGRGVGGDFGLLYTLNSRNEDELYNWKFGFAATDIGAIWFKSQSATYALNSNTVFNAENAVLQQTNSLSALATNGSTIVYEAASQAYTGSKYTMELPMGISFSASKSLTHNFYVEALAVQRIPFGTNEVVRPNTIALTPSFQKSWIAVALPLVMYDESKMYFGLSFRIGPLTVGSDNIKSWFIPGNYYGTDIYVGLHINPLTLFTDKNGNFRNPFHKHAACPKF